MPISISPRITDFPGVTGYPGITGSPGVAGTSSGGWLPPPVVDIDFGTGKFLQNGVQTPSMAAYTTANTNTYYFNSSGVLTIMPGIGATPPIAYDPVSMLPIGSPLPARWDNEITNPRAVGFVPGTPGTAPSGWIVNAGTGISITSVGSGLEDGIPYIDCRFFGTPTGATASVNVAFSSAGVAAAVTGKTYAGSFFCRLVGGAWPATMVTEPSIITTFFNSVPASIQANTVTITRPTAAPLRSQRFFSAIAATVAAIASGRVGFICSIGVGVVTDFTIRVGLPSFVQGTELNIYPSMPLAGAQAQQSGGPSAMTVTMPAGLLRYTTSMVSGHGKYNTANQTGGLTLYSVGNGAGTSDTVIVDNVSAILKDVAAPSNIASVTIPANAPTLAIGRSFAGSGNNFNGAANSIAVSSSGVVSTPNDPVVNVQLSPIPVTAGQVANGMGLQSIETIKVYASALSKSQLLAAMTTSGATPLMAGVGFKRTHFIVDGQSLSVGAEGSPPISILPTEGTFMYGDEIPAGFNGETEIWDRVGPSAFTPMRTLNSSEVSIAGALRHFRRLWLNAYGKASDANIGFVASSVGVGGVGIQRLMKGAAFPELYQRYLSCMSQAKAQAVIDGSTYGFGGILWLQGESNQSTSTEDYKSYFTQMINDMLADAMATSGQALPPRFYTYQTATNPNFAARRGGTAQAQLEVALSDARVTMIGPVYPVPDSANLHLVANPYRWIGAMFGKAMHQTINLNRRFLPLHMTGATRNGNDIIAQFRVPSPPLVFEDPWLQSGFSGGYGIPPLAQTNTQFPAPDKGFVLRNSTTNVILPISTVTISSPTTITITPVTPQAPTTPLILSYADGSNNNYGHGCVRDSDPATSFGVWEQVVGATPADTNPTLFNQAYKLYNWAAAQFIQVT